MLLHILRSHHSISYIPNVITYGSSFSVFVAWCVNCLRTEEAKTPHYNLADLHGGFLCTNRVMKISRNLPYFNMAEAKFTQCKTDIGVQHSRK